MNLSRLCDICSEASEVNQEGLDKTALLGMIGRGLMGAGRWVAGNKMKTFIGAGFLSDAAASAEKFTQLAEKPAVPGFFHPKNTM